MSDETKMPFNNDPVLNLIIKELMSIHHCHTIILYGSRARGDHTSTSDYDVAGISKSGETKRIARIDPTYEAYLDIFIYPENDLSPLRPEHLTMSDGIVLVDSNEFGTNLLAKLKLMANEPEAISEDEIQVRKVWYKKMLSRASVRDLEGKYRHIWAIFVILEDYFDFRKLRYHGPKKAFQYLEQHDQEALSLFEQALSNTDDLKILEELIRHVVDV